MKAVFLDRDGVINSYPGEGEYVKSWGEFHILPNVKPALKRLNEEGFKIFIISNQAGVSKGLFSQEDLNILTQNMLKELNEYKIDISGVYYCTHLNGDNCSCRKPKTGLVDMAVAVLKNEGMRLELSDSYFIGDSQIDVKTGRSAGLKTILIFSGKEKEKNRNNWQVLPDFTAQDLSAAVDLILRKRSSSMKIVIAYASAGAGHRKAAEAIYNYCREESKLLDITLIDIMERSHVLFRTIYIYGYLFLAKYAQWLWGFLFWITSRHCLIPLNNVWMSFIDRIHTRPFAEFLVKESPDIVISTHFLPARVAAYLKKKEKIESKLITVITDFGIHPFWIADGTDTYIVASSFTKKLLLAEGIAFEKIKDFGIPIDPKFNRVSKKNGQTKKFILKSHTLTVLITTGSFAIGPIEKIVELLYKDVQLIVVCAKNKRLYNKLKKKMYPDVIVFGYVDNIHELMAVSDIVIAKPGGLTTSEILSMELIPIFICPIPGQETKNIEAMKHFGIGNFPKRIEDIKTIVLDYKRHPDRIQETKEIIGKLKKPDACKDIYDVIR